MIFDKRNGDIEGKVGIATPACASRSCFLCCVACSARMRAALDDLMTFATYAYYNTGSSFDLLRTRAKKAVCLITSWVSDRPFSLPYVSLRVAVPRGAGAPNTIFRVRLSIAGATIASRARTRSRRRRPRDPAGDDDVSRAHARCRAAAERAETRARRRLPRPRRCREAASRRRPLFHDTARGDVPCLEADGTRSRRARREEARDPAPRPC